MTAATVHAMVPPDPGPSMLADLARLRGMIARGEARTLRLEAGISLREFATAIDVAPFTICRWERGDQKPSGDCARRYLAALDAIDAVVTDGAA